MKLACTLHWACVESLAFGMQLSPKECNNHFQVQVVCTLKNMQIIIILHSKHVFIHRHPKDGISEISTLFSFSCESLILIVYNLLSSSFPPQCPLHPLPQPLFSSSPPSPTQRILYNIPPITVLNAQHIILRSVWKQSVPASYVRNHLL